MDNGSGSPNDAFRANKDQPAALISHVVPQSATSMAANPNAIESCPLLPRHLAPEDSRTFATQRQDQAIHNLLQRGTDPDHIPKYVETHRAIWSTGNGDDLARIAEIPRNQLPARIHNASQ